MVNQTAQTSLYGWGKINGTEFRITFDTGASHSVMMKDATKAIGRTPEGKKEEMVRFDNHMTLSEGQLKNVPVQIKNVIVPIDFKVFDSGSQEILIRID